eukprot:CAMPEP_0197832720 /NCGR_PEP_ID=MMETSP1437-20131217/15797_1 /TAXON_ID=49252 ORGANISM="Eucampia antarctica, Strain CCMP1452" /NCGR_SAMPLE_ID=MMETSP1437 /ASSEMBLY_ACC=CAM_ASM_001096 /LENGTH=297 /DNA_ID=CAMNT_0043436251 /DNA_START=240 /DNA_END=1133 /DNA_ORIENTATION=-
MSSESALKSFLSGGFGGVCTVIIGHPFDLIKVRIQTGAAANSSTFGMLGKMFASGGIRGIYRGVSAPLTAVTPMFAVSFWGYDMGKRIVQYATNNTHGTNLSISQLCMAGGISAIPCTVVMTPSERIKCLLQVQANEVEKGKKPKYTGLMDCAKQVYKEGGIRSIYKGTGATLLRDIPGSIAWFGTYELVKKELMRIQNIDPASGQLSPLAVLSAGGFAGVVCWTIQIPADTLKSRFQTASPGQYTGILDVYQRLVKEEGHSALFRGFRPAMIRAFPANAACFFGMEVSREALSFLD